MKAKLLWSLVMGPALGMLYMIFLPVVFLSFLILLLADTAAAKSAGASLNGDSEMCLGCHAAGGMTKKLKNNETLSVSVNARHLSASVHGSLGCSDCHQDISMANHPADRAFKSLEDFRITTAKLCKTCHSDESFKARRMHYQAITQSKAPPCTECHSAHTVQRIVAMKASLSNNQYCLACHKLNFAITSTKSSISISASQLHDSVHKNNDCVSCHTGFSKEEHPLNTFAGKREHSITLSQTCKKCHADKWAQYDGSIHVSMLRKGNLNAPVCTDCHGFHTVSKKAVYNTMSGVPCKNCHKDIFAAYAKSVHGKAMMDRPSGAPICSSCHYAHDIKAAVLNKKIKDSCLGCHKDTGPLHQKWLPNAVLHLDSVSCPVCHSPDAGGRIFLRLVDLKTREPFTEEQIIKLLGKNYQVLIGLMAQRSKAITFKELGDMIGRLNAKNAETKVTFVGSLSAGKGIEAHKLALKKNAVRECEKCHSAESAAFRGVTFAFIENKLETELFSTESEILGSIFVLPVRHFYVLRSTRLKMLDVIGILMVAGGVSFPIVHLILRKVTAPIRKRRKEESK